MKTLPIDNCWNFATFKLYTVPAKFLYLKRYSTDFRNLCLSSKMLKVGIWVGRFMSARILLLQWQGVNFAHRQNLKFFQIQPVHCASKNPISAKIFNRFSKSFPPLVDVEGENWGGKFHMRWYFTFAMERLKLSVSTTYEILPLSTCTLWQQNPISAKVFNRFSKSLPQLEDIEGGHLGGKCQLRRHFTVAMARWKLCASTTLEILPLSTCTLCQQKSCISKSIQPIFEIFAHFEDVEGGHLGGEFYECRYFIFAMDVEILRIDNIWNFAKFNLFTVPVKIQYLQRYSPDIRNLCLSSKLLRVGIWVESFRCAGILLLQWQGENFALPQHMKFCQIQPVHCASKILYLHRYSNDFRNLGPSSKILRVGIWVESFRGAGILLLQWQGENVAHRQHWKNCQIQPVHCVSKNLISPKIFNRFSKSFPPLEDVEGGNWGGGKFHMRWYITFEWLKLCASKTYEIWPLSTCALCQQNPISPKVLNRFSKSSPQLDAVQGGDFRGKFQMRRYFTVAMAWWKLCASTTFEILPLSTCTLGQQKSYISKGILSIFEIFASARRCWGWPLVWKASGAQVISFWNGEVKTLCID